MIQIGTKTLCLLIHWPDPESNRELSASSPLHHDWHTRADALTILPPGLMLRISILGMMRCGSNWQRENHEVWKLMYTAQRHNKEVGKKEVLSWPRIKQGTFYFNCTSHPLHKNNALNTPPPRSGELIVRDKYIGQCPKVYAIERPIQQLAGIFNIWVVSWWSG